VPFKVCLYIIQMISAYGLSWELTHESTGLASAATHRSFYSSIELLKGCQLNM
jgi:hypothetical protein